MEQNQFAQSAVKGLMTHNLGNSIPVVIDPDEAGTLVPGQAVKLTQEAGSNIFVEKVAVNTDIIFGVIPFVRNSQEFVAGDALEVVLPEGVLYMEAGAAIARGAEVMVVVTGSKVVTATTGKAAIGTCLDIAAADGDLVRIKLFKPALVA